MVMRECGGLRELYGVRVRAGVSYENYANMSYSIGFQG